MNHETLQALYQLDVAEVGEEEAAKRWEYWAIGDKMWNTCTPNLMFIGQGHRRKPDIPWPKVIGQTYNSRISECRDALLNGRGALEAVLDNDQTNAVLSVFDEYMTNLQEWPVDAPEWANYLTADESGAEYFHERLPYATVDVWCSGSKAQHKVACPNWRDSLIERPKPAVKKIDWSKLRAELYFHIKPRGELKLPSPWIAWNCDEHTRGNPLPDGLAVEWFGTDNLLRGYLRIDWDDVTRFRIVGIQEGWE